MAPNVLLVVLDTARADALEPYGAPRGQTPAIAQLADRGVAHPHAYATTSWTLPSHASMFTGLMPRRLGLAQAPAGTPQSARPRIEEVAHRFLPLVLRQSGFATEGWTTNLWVSHHAGFDLGFDRFRYVQSGRDERMNSLLGQGRRAQLAWALEGLRSRSDDGAAEVGRELRESIARWGGQPTFWFVNLSECHSPYLPPRPWNDLPAAERVRAAYDSRAHLNFVSICMFVAGRHEVPPEAIARMRHLYGRAVAYMDDWLAGVLDALAARGILDDTLVIVTSDHGENFGEGGLMAHGFSLDERLIHVPFVAAGPGAPTDSDVLSLASLPRLIAAAAGLDERAPWPADELPSGVALAEYDPMGDAEIIRSRDAEHGWGLSETGIDRLSARFTAAVDGANKLVIRNGKEYLYDLRTDPGEASPLHPYTAGPAFEPLRAVLAEADRAHATAPLAPAASAPAQATEAELAAIEQQMKLLGYM